MDRDSRQPRGKLRSAGKLIKVRIGADVCILHHILRLSIVAQNSARNSVYALVVAPHDDLEQRRLTLQNSPYNFLVCEGLGCIQLFRRDGFHCFSYLYRGSKVANGYKWLC